MQKLIGLILVLSCVFGGFVLAKGNLAALWQPAEMLIIVGAALGALFIGNSMEVLKETWKQLKTVVANRAEDKSVYRELICLLYSLLEEMRLKGLKGLDEHVEDPYSSPLFSQFPAVLSQSTLVHFMADNLRMLSMGKMTAHELEALMEQEIMAMENDLLKPSKALHGIADAMPGFGILAAVGGIIITMQHLDGPLSSVGVHVAAALVGTFIGIFGCYCLFEPASTAMAEWVGRRISTLECIKAALVAHVSGKSPLLAVDAGRKALELDVKPSFSTMESWVEASGMEGGPAEEDSMRAAAGAENVAPMRRRRSDV